MIDYCKKIIAKLASQAENGRITIGDEELGFWGYYIRFSMQFEGQLKSTNNPTFIVQNNDLFFKNIAKYLKEAQKFYIKDKKYFDLSDHSFDEKLIMDVLINATNFDLQNIEKYLEQRTAMLKSKFEDDEINLGSYQNCHIIAKIQKNLSNLEAPYRFNLEFIKDNDTFKLPSITFGVVDKKAYIYAVQSSKTKQTSKLAKQLDRYLRKLNNGVDMSSLEANISTNALASLTIFIEYLKSIGITELNAPNFMPIRYNAGKVTGVLKSKTKQEKTEFLLNHNRNQYNITNKLMNLILRYNYHFPTNTYCYDDYKQEMNLKIKEFISTSENIIYDLQDSILNNELKV